jgi:hypothetical protein
MSAKDHFEAQQAYTQAIRDRHAEHDGRIGNAEVDAEDVMDVDDLYDSEQIAINQVSNTLARLIGTGMEGSAFQREARERFAEIGFVVRCDLKKDMLDPRPWDEKPWIPEISLIGRTEKQGEFDHDRMGHEVRSNILGKNAQGSVQKTQVAPGWSQSGSGLIVPGT